MASPSSNPFYGSNAGMSSANSSYQRLALDNLIRRELKVSDPNDPKAIAQALMERFKDDPRARAIGNEARGLPFLLTAPVAPGPAQAATSSDAELQQAKDDVERDLRELLTNSLLKDVTPEIQGWAQAVRSAITEGSTAARFGLDPRQRDKAFAIRRQLGDYARLARLVGALTPTLSMTYRKFAQSLDEVAAVILVMLGEALANVGFNGGRFLLQAPYTELQVRRDAAIYALRNLTGATQQAYGPNEWPRGLDAYRRLYDVLERQGQGDLRALLVEHELSRIMDELIQRAAHGQAEGLRALGSTAQLDLERFRRLVIVGRFAVSPESPALTAFLESLQLFADAFQPSGGFRLMRIARPPILFYGLYGTTTLEDADHRLLELIILRGRLADLLDCFLECGCSKANVKCQIVLDKILYDLDRAIDLYAMGKSDFGEPERRASAYGFVIEAFLDTVGHQAATDRCVLPPKLVNAQNGYLVELKDKLSAGFDGSDPQAAEVIGDLVNYADEVRDKLVEANAGEIIVDGDSVKVADKIAELIDEVSPPGLTAGNIDTYTDLLDLLRLAQIGQAQLLDLGGDDAGDPPRSVADYLEILQQEICIQENFEQQWRELVKSMAPNCYGIDEVLDGVQVVLGEARKRVSGARCLPFKPSIPPHFETSLDSIVDDVDRMGRGRANGA